MSATNPEQDEKNICASCVRESHLQLLIKTGGANGFCSYCDEEGLTLSVEAVADLVERAFEDHYERTATEPDGYEYAMGHDWERSGEEAKWAILNAMDTSEEIAEDVRSLLEDRHYDHDSAQVGDECPFSDESHYAEKDAGHGEFLQLWNAFSSSLKTRSRFFSSSAKSILDQIFHGISDLLTVSGKPVVVTAGPGMPIATLYRARVFAGESEKLKEALAAPWKHLGTPPSEAANAGRMNARGIAVFYGARDSNTALSEVRPPVGSKVAIATFDILRPLRLLDLTALRSVSAGGSIFDPDSLGRMQRRNFLFELSHLMSGAVMPHEEASEYLPTQAVAEYLANEAHLDGIIFPSVQTGQESSNVVLFHHAARVEEVELPRGAKVDIQLETGDSDGIHPDYRVWEKVPSSNKQGEVQRPPSHWMLGLEYPLCQDSDYRASTLRIDLENIFVHHVRAVTFDAPSHTVTRHRL